MIKFKRLIKSFVYAWRGLIKVIHEEQNFRIELFFAILVIILALLTGFNYIELSILIIVIGLVLLMEIINSAVELISDVIKPKLDHYVKTIKDMVATAVMMSSLVAVVVGLLLFWHHLLNWHV